MYARINLGVIQFSINTYYSYCEFNLLFFLGDTHFIEHVHMLVINMVLAIIEIKRGCISIRSLRAGMTFGRGYTLMRPLLAGMTFWAGMTFGVSESHQSDSFLAIIH